MAAVSFLTPVPEARATGEPVLASPVRTVGDLIIADKMTEQRRKPKQKQQQQQEQQQSPTKNEKPKGPKEEQQESVAEVASPAKARDTDAGADYPPVSP